MTSKPKQLSVDAGTLEVFPDFPPRDDLQNSIYLDGPAHQAALEEHFGNRDSTVILSEIPVRLTPSQSQGHRIPDLLVSPLASTGLRPSSRTATPSATSASRPTSCWRLPR